MKIGRNEPCPCGSGKKYKQCCLGKKLASNNKSINVTHEPQIPLPNFPLSHVKVDDVFHTDNDECMKITIHGTEHYLHQTTAFSLYEQLQKYFKDLPVSDKQLKMQMGWRFGKELL